MVVKGRKNAARTEVYIFGVRRGLPSSEIHGHSRRAHKPACRSTLSALSTATHSIQITLAQWVEVHQHNRCRPEGSVERRAQAH